MKTLIAAAALCLVGTTLAKGQDGWVGLRESEVIAKLGTPNAVKSKRGGRKVFVYKFGIAPRTSGHVVEWTDCPTNDAEEDYTTGAMNTVDRYSGSGLRDLKTRLWLDDRGVVTRVKYGKPPRHDPSRKPRPSKRDKSGPWRY